ncbi:MAG: hypothetical protein KTR15_12500 [Phycisphaeraceae bacterium]|nr:hypothetical protein [Phycisphaeraceae bacterium]
MKKSHNLDAGSATDLYREHTEAVYRIVDQMIRASPYLERHRDDMVDAGLGERGLTKAINSHDPDKATLATHIKAVVRKAIRAKIATLTRPRSRSIRVGLEDELVAWELDPDMSLDAVNEDGMTGHDLIHRDRRAVEQLSPLEELIRAEKMDALANAVDPDLYEALLEYHDAAHGDGSYILAVWADRLGFDSPNALRKALERERKWIEEQLGEDFLA